MSAPELSVIAERAIKHAWDLDVMPWKEGVNRDRFFFPENLTPLSFTESYGLLNHEERLQYNHWYAMGVGEQFIFLEQEVLNGVVEALLEVRGLIPGEMRPLLETFVEEENKHTDVFRRLLRLSWPEVYDDRDYHFFNPGAVSRQIAKVVRRAPQYFVAWPFLALALEEKTVAFYRAYERACLEGGEDELCALHRSVHRYHMLDETRHIHLDEHLIELLWDPAPGWLRAINRKILFRSLGQYTSPRPRSVSVNIVHALCDRFERLAPHRERMVAEVRGLKQNPAYQRHVYGREAMPRTFAAFDRYPELQAVREVAPSYRPLEVG